MSGDDCVSAAVSESWLAVLGLRSDPVVRTDDQTLGAPCGGEGATRAHPLGQRHFEGQLTSRHVMCCVELTPARRGSRGGI